MEDTTMILTDSQAPTDGQAPTDSQAPTDGQVLTEEIITAFAFGLKMRRMSVHTCSKYVRDARMFARFLDGRPVTQETVYEYREKLLADGYAPSSINTMAASLNALFAFLGNIEVRAKGTRIQKQIFRSEAKELTMEEYNKLTKAASDRERLILEAICSTGIRISELQYFTVESVRLGVLNVTCKNKTRTVMLPADIQELLLEFAEKSGITSGLLFFGRNGQPIHRGTVWAMMKRIAKQAEIPESKVFPHNLRKLFARRFYEMDHDIAKLADILGHSSIETTRIYIMTTGKEHQAILERLGLIPDAEKLRREKEHPEQKNPEQKCREQKHPEQKHPAQKKQKNKKKKGKKRRSA